MKCRHFSMQRFPAGSQRSVSAVGDVLDHSALNHFAAGSNGVMEPTTNDFVRDSTQGARRKNERNTTLK